MSKINKALDYNKLLNEQAEGKLLKKHLSFPRFTSTKYDGNYVCVQVTTGSKLFVTSGGLTYTHTDKGGDVFEGVKAGAYFAERIYGEGKIGDRDKCNLRGPKDAQTSTGHTYKVFDYISIEDYIRGYSETEFVTRFRQLHESGVPKENIADYAITRGRREMDELLVKRVKEGYEGLMTVDPMWCWKDTTSRTVDLAKYKKRPTADLLCIGTTEGEGKYVGLIGAVILQDSAGRVCSVGSGLSDSLRTTGNFLNTVVEIEYERIADTYIQPSFVRIREDKTVEEID